jgi:signal transduction histidine kinase
MAKRRPPVRKASARRRVAKSPAADLKAQNATLRRELAETRQQQVATAEVLKVISRSPSDTQPVFDAIVRSGVNLFADAAIAIALPDGDAVKLAAIAEKNAARAKAWRRRFPFPLTHEYMHSIAILDRKLIDIADVQEHTAGPFARGAKNFLKSGYRAVTITPMLRGDQAIGVISVIRLAPGPLSAKQIELLRTFADQAVIAIENMRLFNELRQRTGDLSESLERQTATSEVLQVISSSPGELEPVFTAVLENATRICGATFGILFLSDGNAFRTGAMHNAPPALIEARRREPLFRPPPHSALGRMIETKQSTQIADMLAERGYFDAPPGYSIPQIAQLAGARTVVAVPMIKDEELIGAIVIYRQEVRPFTDKQIELVSNFAAQAVIAIENTRLLNELRQRTDDLSESLEQQTATSEVLKVISGSPGELAPVFQAMLENATRICGAKFGFLWLSAAKGFRAVALHGVPSALVNERQREPMIHSGPDIPLGRLAQTKAVVHVHDLTAEKAYLAGVPTVVELAEVGGARTLLLVPMLKDNNLVGAISIYRQEVNPFTDKQVALLTSFAAQAVIAIENTRLLSELRESLQQQTATADVLKVISRSTFDLQPVFDSMAESAVRLCEAERAYIFRFDGSVLRAVASFNAGPENQDWVYRNPIPLGRQSVSARAGLERRTVQVADVQADTEYNYVARDVEPIRTSLAVPMLKGDDLIGTITIYRLEVKLFTEQQIALMETFADQAVIAIENVRLFDEIQDKSRQLAEASQHKSQFVANMSHELRTPLNAILGYTELIADGVYGQPTEKMLEVLKRLESNGKHLLGLINDVLDLSKIEAGQLVLDLSDYSLQDVAQTVYSAVEPLAADKKLKFKAEVAPGLPPGRGDGRRLTQVLLNLVGNAIKFTDSGEVVIRADAGNGSFDLSVHDTGPGISAADQAKLFQEFQQADNSITRKKGGTGLGLAISKRIIELHGGRIWVESELGRGSTFFVSLPVQAQAKPSAK